MPGKFVQGFSTQPDEIRIESLPLTGNIPGWLNGTLVRNGPGQFEVGTTRFTYRHWFDGLAMLHSFTIRDGQVSYANRYLQSRAYEDDNENGLLNYSGFASDPCRTFFSRVMTVFNPPQPGENAVVNVAKLADKYIAMTETPLPVEFDPKTLATLGVVQYDDPLDGQVTTAHPHFDSERGVGFNHMLSFGVQTTYRLYSLTDTERHVIATIPVQRPAYIHSFGMTENYLILAEFSLRLYRLFDLATGKRPFIENFEWRDEDSIFYVVAKDNGQIVAKIPADPFFAFHHINAFEQENSVIVDVCAYDNARLIDELYLEHLHSMDGLNEIPQVRRYTLPLNGSRADYRLLTEENLELPRINYHQHNGHDYRYIYGTGIRHGTVDFLNQLVKVDVSTGEALLWHEPGCYPGEGVFVPAPNAKSEDDGLLLSVVLDSTQSNSFLLILNAADFSEVARATVPQHIPFGFHGQFFTEI